jgi:hypothetical protein
MEYVYTLSSLVDTFPLILNQSETTTGNNRHAEKYTKSITTGATSKRYRQRFKLICTIMCHFWVKWPPKKCISITTNILKSPTFSVDHPKQDTDNGSLYIVGNKSEANYTGRRQFYKIISFMNNRFKVQAFIKTIQTQTSLYSVEGSTELILRLQHQHL